MERLLELTRAFCSDENLLPVIEKVEEGRRLSFEDGLSIMNSPDLGAVGMMADYVKRRKTGEKVYFVVNRHVNPSNICAISCRFCAFGTTKKSAEALRAFPRTDDLDAERRDEGGSHSGRASSRLGLRPATWTS